MEASNLCNVSSQSNNLIKLTHYDKTMKMAHDSQIVRAKENIKLSHGKNFPTFIQGCFNFSFKGGGKEYLCSFSESHDKGKWGNGKSSHCIWAVMWEKFCLRGQWQGHAQTSLLNYRD